MPHVTKCFAALCIASILISSPSFAQTSAELELRLAAIEEALRELRGTVEENDYRVRKLSEEVAKFRKDTDFRFEELSNTPSEPVAAPSPAPAPVSAAEETPSPLLPSGFEEKKPVNTEPAQTTAGDGVLRSPSFEHPDYSTPRDLYNYAFRLLNQTKYAQSADAFGMFIKQYPKDPLIGNAHYWQGETYYIRRDYVNAADSFRQGFEVLPNGPKAPDNLLKLAMSLSALDRDKEACIVLRQITTKYRQQSIGVSDKAKNEQRRIGC